MEDRDRILEFWFEGFDDDTVVTTELELHKWWFDRSPEMIQKIAEGFKPDVKRASYGEYDGWKDPQGRLALVIVCDQFSRCLGYGTAQAYENDLKALEAALFCVKKGEDKELTLFERLFLYLPLMHSETDEIQTISVQKYTEIVNEAQETEDKNIAYFQYVLNMAENHAALIHEFKRFPQRNKILKRKSTSTEINYVQNEKHLLET